MFSFSHFLKLDYWKQGYLEMIDGLVDRSIFEIETFLLDAS